MKHKSLITILLASALLLQGCGTVTEPDPPKEPQKEEETEEFDPERIRPQDDFNGYVNAKALLEADITEHHGSTGSFEQIGDMVDDELDTIIENIVKGDRSSYAAGSNEQLIYDIYYQALEASTGGVFMDQEDIDSMFKTVEDIRNTASIDEFLDICGRIYSEWNVNPIFGTSIDTDMHDSASGSIWIRPFQCPTGQKLEDISLGGQMAQVVAMYFRTKLVDLGMGADEARQKSVADTKLIMDIALDTDLELLELISKDWGAAMQTAVYRSDKEIDVLCPNVGADGILRTIGIRSDMADGVYLWDEGQLSGIDSLLTEEHLNEWQDIAVMCYMKSIEDMLPKEYGGRSYLYSNDLLAKDMIKMLLPKELGEEYVKNYYDEDTVAAVVQITDAIVDEYIVMIDDCEWLSDEGKTAIAAKLDNMLYFIGADAPHKIKAEDAKLVGHSVYETKHNLNMRDYKDNMKVLKEGVERNGFEMMAPQTVNACYSPDMNSINITAAIMNAPFYSPDQSYWENLGGIGAVVGHEISHAFDNHGMMYDMNGNYDPSWIPEEDRKAFDEMASRIEEYYSEQRVLDIHPVDGELTLGENLADISGVDCILRLTKNNEQRKELLENYARIWASVMPKDDVLGRLYMDEHSPAKVRVNAVVALFDPFYEIYDVKEGDAMYIAPEDRVTRW